MKVTGMGNGGRQTGEGDRQRDREVISRSGREVGGKDSNGSECIGMILSMKRMHN